MAIPPEPIDQVLPDAAAAVVGEVSKVVQQDPQAPMPKPKKPGMTDVGGVVARQVVALKVSEVLFGAGAVKVGDTVEVEKPAGDYTLSVGNQGPFLLGTGAKGGPKLRILGRYGPDTYPVELIKDRAKKLGKK